MLNQKNYQKKRLSICLQTIRMKSRWHHFGKKEKLCFYGNLDEKISDSLFYAYRYFEDGKMGKVICYAYDTAKTKLLNESGTGMTMKYNNTTKRLQVDDVTMYDDGLYDVIHQLGMKSF